MTHLIHILPPGFRRQPFWLSAFTILFVFNLLACWQTVLTFQELPTGLWGSEWGWLLFGIFLTGVLVGLVLFLLAWLRPALFDRGLFWLEAHSRPVGWVSLFLFFLLFVAFIAALWLRIPSVYLPGLSQRLALFVWVVMANMLALKGLHTRFVWRVSAALAALAVLVLLQAVSVLQGVTDNPFSQGWSEGSLIYYSSLVFSPRIYGSRLPLAWVYPTRAFLDSLPFIIPSSPIWAYRLWGALLSLGFSALTALLLVRRLHLTNVLIRLALAAAAFIFLLQVGFKYELQLCVIIILVGMDTRRPLRSLLCVALASFWGGISRMNWIPVPAVLAVLLYFMEEPVPSKKGWLRYLFKPAWVFLFGVVVGFAGLYFSLALSDTSLTMVIEVGTSRSLWYRLLPNPLYGPGVLLSSLLIILPLFLFISLALRKRTYHFFRLLGIFTILLVLALGGLLVSSKIGGGGDMHNMDAFMAAILITGYGFAYNQVVSEREETNAFSAPVWVLASGIFILAVFSIFHLQPYHPPSRASSEAALAVMRPVIEDAAARGEVLFLNQRQLWIFDEVEDVPMLHDHDVVILAAMVNLLNYSQVDLFQEDLQAQRFSLIVADIQKDDIQDIYHHPFAEENNLWVDAISRVLLCYYQPVLELPEQGVALYTPVSQPSCQP